MNSPAQPVTAAGLRQQSRSQLARVLAKAREAYERDIQNTAGLTQEIAAKISANESAINRSLAADLDDGDIPGSAGGGEASVLNRLLAGGGFSAALQKAEARLNDEAAGASPAENGPDVDAARKILGQLLHSLRAIAAQNARLAGEGTLENPYVLTSDAPLRVSGPCLLGAWHTKPAGVALWPNENRLYVVPNPALNS